MGSVLREFTVDCADALGLARWWGQVLDWPVTESERGFVWLSATGRQDTPPLLLFVPVPDAKTVKNRIHFDVNPTGVDQAEELERLLALGARRVDIGQDEDAVPWVVLADPEGNEFCLLGRRFDPPDSQAG
jgi:hypothetical protein